MDGNSDNMGEGSYETGSQNVLLEGKRRSEMSCCRRVLSEGTVGVDFNGGSF